MDAWRGMQKIKRLDHVFERQLCEIDQNIWTIEAGKHTTQWVESIMAWDRKGGKRDAKNRYGYRPPVVNKVSLVWQPKLNFARHKGH